MYEFEPLPPGKKPICRQCAYFTHEFVPPTIVPGSEILLVGDSPWRQEALRREVFVGPAGEVLDTCLEEVGLNRAEISVTNSVLCKPAALGEDFPPGVANLCREHFLKPLIAELKPKLVVPMGNIAMKAIAMKDKGNILKVRGTFQDIDFFDQRIHILPTVHPSFVLRQPAMLDYMLSDLQLAAQRSQCVNPITIQNVHYQHIDTLPKFERFWSIVKDAKELAWDLETTSISVKDADVLSMSITLKECESFVITFFLESHIKLKSGKTTIDSGTLHNYQIFSTYVLRKLYQLLHSGKVIYFHNGKFDLRHMHYWFFRNLHRGIDIDRIRWYDTQGMQGLLNENMRQGLKEIASLHTDIRYAREDLDAVHGGKLSKIPLSKLVRYNGADTDACFRIARKYTQQMVSEGLWYGPFVGQDYSDMTVANVLFKMEEFGAPIDRNKLFEIRHMVQRRIQELYGEMVAFTDGIVFPKNAVFNPNSYEHIRLTLFDHLRLPDTGVKTGTGKISTNEESINLLMEMYPDHAFLKAFKLYQKYNSIIKTFINGFYERLWDDNRVRPDFSFTKAVSGRILCYDPNILNIPRDKEFEEGILLSVRDMFAARPGYKIVYGDSSQIEFKCCAYLSGDQRLMEDVFVHHEDFHDLIAKSAYPWYADLESRVKVVDGRDLPVHVRVKVESAKIRLKTGRTSAKEFNFAWMFGAENERLAQAIGVTVDQVEVFTGRIERRYPKFWRYVKSVAELSIKAGVVINPFMRKRRIPSTPDERTQAALGRKASNFGPQSTAGYIGRGALTRIANRCDGEGLDGFPFNIVYDAILLECPDEEVEQCKTIVVEEMLRPVPEVDNYIFSIEAGVGQSWRAAEASARKYYTVDDLEE